MHFDAVSILPSIINQHQQLPPIYNSKMVGYSLSTVAAITAMSGSVAAFTTGTSGWARSTATTRATTTGSSKSLAFSSIRLCGACSQCHGNTCACSSCSRMSHSVSYSLVTYYMIIAGLTSHHCASHILCTSICVSINRLSAHVLLA